MTLRLLQSFTTVAGVDNTKVCDVIASLQGGQDKVLHAYTLTGLSHDIYMLPTHSSSSSYLPYVCRLLHIVSQSTFSSDAGEQPCLSPREKRA